MSVVNSSRKLRSLEIFVGAGGAAIGLTQAGFHHEVVVDKDDDACKTILLNKKKNHPLVSGWDVRHTDVNHCDLSDVEPEPDLLAGGVPCQPFSICGVGRGAADERNCFPAAIRIVRHLRPRAFVFENVDRVATQFQDYFSYLCHMLTLPDLMINDGESVQDHERRLKHEIKTSKTGLRYRVRHAILKAQDFGTAQSRSRLFIVGLRNDITKSWTTPETTHSGEALFMDQWATGRYWDRHDLPKPPIPDQAAQKLRKIRSNNRPRDLFDEPKIPRSHRTIRDAIGDLPTPRAQSPSWILNHEAPTRQAKPYGTKHAGAHIDEIAKTLRAGVHGVGGGSNMFVNNGFYRHFTGREAARLQDFPDDYEIQGTWSTVLRQIGNAVPCRMARAVGENLAQALQ
jgi:DNA (cytosine-5)-methyltransferase 1